MNWPNDTYVVIPAYRAASLLATLLPKILSFVPGNQILIIDDASEDDTPEVCRHAGVRVIIHATNQGKGAALATGFTAIMHDAPEAGWIITMDADGQHSPGELPRFISAARKSRNAGICIGARLMKPGIMPPERVVSNRLTSFILEVMCGITVKDSQCGYRIYNTALLKKVSITYQRFEMESEIIMKAAFLGFPVTFFPIQTVYLDGPSYISHLKDTIRWVAAVLRIRMRKQEIIRQSTPTEQVQ